MEILLDNSRLKSAKLGMRALFHMARHFVSRLGGMLLKISLEDRYQASYTTIFPSGQLKDLSISRN